MSEKAHHVGEVGQGLGPEPAGPTGVLHSDVGSDDRGWGTGQVGASGPLQTEKKIFQHVSVSWQRM